MLNSVAEFFEEDVATALTAALALIEPAILIVMGVVVVFILISLYLPIFSLGQASGRIGVIHDGRSKRRLHFRCPPVRTSAPRPKRLRARYHAEFVDLKNFKIQHDLLRTVPVELMFRYNFVPIEQQQDALVIAVSDPSRLMVLDEIAGLLGQRILARVATLSQITDLLKKTEQSQRVLDEASEGLTFDVLTGDENQDENISIEKLTSEEDISPIIRLVDTTIFTALERRASDIHIETNDDSVVVKYRIDGVLQAAMAPIAREHHATILGRIKIMSELDIAERRVPQDGRFRVRYKGGLIDFRVSIMPTIHGENAVLRVLDKESMSEKFQHLTLDVVGFAEEDLRRFRRYIREPYGMVLVTGPTGSGKTTTLYAALNEIKSDEDKIITIEDPVEYQIRGITQIPVNEKKGLTFARGLRSILRHDPDKILVGEIRDQETAQIAINSALTGHLVFTTVHANNVVDVLGRFLNMGVEAYNFVSALNCILAQRLVRTICEYCAHTVHYDDETLLASGLDPARVARLRFPRGRGLHGVRRHRLPRPNRDSRAARFDRPDPRDDSRQEAHLGGAQAGAEGGHELSARVGAGARAARHHYAQRDQQGYVYRGVAIVRSILNKDRESGTAGPAGGRRPRWKSPEGRAGRGAFATGLRAARRRGQSTHLCLCRRARSFPGIDEPNLRAPRPSPPPFAPRSTRFHRAPAPSRWFCPTRWCASSCWTSIPCPAKRCRRHSGAALPPAQNGSLRCGARRRELPGVVAGPRPSAKCWPRCARARSSPNTKPRCAPPATSPALCCPPASPRSKPSMPWKRAGRQPEPAGLTTAITNGQDLLLHRTLDLPEDRPRLSEIQRSIAVAAAYFEDKLGAARAHLHYAGI